MTKVEPKFKEFKSNTLIGDLFKAAKKADEFEYCCSLLRIRGMEDVGWDPLFESTQLAHQLIGLINAPVEETLRMRLSLTLYCHLTDMADLYSITGNMLRVVMGHRYVIDPFMGTLHKSEKWAKYPTEKVRRIKEWAMENGMDSLGSSYDIMLVKEVRNAFYHSDYILTEDSFNIRHGKGVQIGREITTRVPYDWLLPRLRLGINTALAVLNLTIQKIESYKADKVVSGRMASDGSYEDVQLTTGEFGLTGFKTPPDDGLRKKG